jgi:tetratricopeptide (TPR) repeat protein
MLSTEDAAIKRKIQRIGTIKAGFRQTKDRRYALESVLRDYYERLRTAQSTTQEDIARSLNALHQALNEPELVEQQLLINFISEIVRFVENVGLGFAFSKAFMDRAIEVYRKAGFSLINLYLEKVSLLLLDQLESVEREQALMEARSYAQAAQDTEGLVRVLLACAAYYTEVSQYQKSLQLCHECERLIQSDAQLKKYTSKVFTYFGMNYTPLFRYQLAKNYLIRAKELLDVELARRDEPRKNDFWEDSMETVHHYLGSIAEAEGNAREAMHYYVEAFRYQQMFI